MQAPPGSVAMKELEEFLQARAMEHDSPSLLFQLACEYLISARVIRPGVVRLAKKVAHLLTTDRTGELDRLTKFDAGLGMTRLAWLTKPAVRRRFLAQIGRRSANQALGSGAIRSC